MLYNSFALCVLSFRHESFVEGFTDMVSVSLSYMTSPLLRHNCFTNRLVTLYTSVRLLLVRLKRTFRLRNDLNCVEWDVKPCSTNHVRLEHKRPRPIAFPGRQVAAIICTCVRPSLSIVWTLVFERQCLKFDNIL